MLKVQYFSRRKSKTNQSVQGPTDLNFRCANLCHKPICTLPMVDTGLHDFP